MKLLKILLFIAFSLISHNVYSQNVLVGQVTDPDGKGLVGITVQVKELNRGAATDSDGFYELKLPEDQQTFRVLYSSISHENQERLVSFFSNKRQTQDIVLTESSQQIGEISVIGNRSRPDAGTMTRLDNIKVEQLPTAGGGGVEALLKTLPSVASNNELSSQYSVRGGNFDENLVYVNDFEVYRPFLVRSGQQEGLSFINSDLVQSIAFSAGAFEPKYGDKLSSVLDIKYKQPQEFEASIGASLLGANAYVGGTSENKLLTYVLGVRQRSNSYLLDALPTEGGYRPLFVDVQSFLTYDLGPEWQWQFIGNYSKNRYEFTPNSGEFQFGEIQNVKRLRIAFEGKERDEYESLMAGTGFVYTPDKQNLILKFLTSGFTTTEEENFDIIGEYYLGEVENDQGSEDFGEVTREFGIGTYHDFARNDLNARIWNISHKGYLDKGKHYFNWGLKYQYEDIQDKLNEWQRIDSTGFSLSSANGVFSTGPNLNEVELFNVLKTEFNLKSHRLMGFVQDSWTFGAKDRAVLTGGFRFNYWTVNKELLFTPRLQLSWKPKQKMKNKEKEVSSETEEEYGKDIKPKKDVSFRLATGMYHQPPFYREMRNLKGEVNTNLRSQKSAHLVGGMDLEFQMWGRPFKFTSEAYYKYMWDLVPYELDNVLIRYFGENRAVGYSAGLEFRLNGEFVKGTESWFSLSLLQTREDIDGDFFTKYFDENGERVPENRTEVIVDSTTTELGFIPRPTDQVLNFAIFFQDNLPNNENFKMNLNLLFGTPLPYSGPRAIEQRNKLRFGAPYVRVDIGFSAQLFELGKKEIPINSWLNRFDSVWAAIEVFNLLDVDNIISYQWLSDFAGLYYAIPNRLTGRRLNARLIMKF